jgi:hypothetical protein
LAKNLHFFITSEDCKLRRGLEILKESDLFPEDQENLQTNTIKLSIKNNGYIFSKLAYKKHELAFA